MENKETVTAVNAKARRTAKETAADWALLTLGTLVLTVGVYFFKYPNNFAMGGVSGLSVVLGKVIPFLSPARIVTILNVLYLIIGFIFLGHKIGIRTVYCSLLFPGALSLLEVVMPLSAPLTDQPFLELCFAILLPGAGSAIVFNRDGSTGGSDILALILKKYLRIEVGRALLLADFLVVIAAFFMFDVRTGLYSLLGLLAKAFLVDSIIESINTSKFFIIVTSKPEPIVAYIESTLHRGATEWEGIGCYTGEKRTLLLVVMNRAQAMHMRSFVHTVDEHAFVLISSSSDIIGKGFRQTG